MLRFPGINIYSFKAHATDLPKKDLFGKSDPYLVFWLPSDVQGEKKLKVKDKKLRKSFEVAATMGEIAVGVTATTAIALATGAAVVVFPIAMGALGAFAIKKATRLHPAKPDYNEIFVSEVIKRNLNPTWAEFHLGFHAQMLVECFDWNRAQSSKPIGSCWVTVQKLLTTTAEFEFEFIDSKSRKAGKLFLSCTPVPKP